MAEVYTGLVRKSITMSRSNPSLAASFNLREHSQSRGKLQLQKSSSGPALVLEEIDRLGGNGRWRQRKADDYFREKEVEELERQRVQREIEARRLRRRQEIEARRRRQQQEEEQKREAERERVRRDREHKDAVRRKDEDNDRLRREQEQRDWEARQPYACEACAGSGKCQRCEGKGQLFALFLVNSVDRSARMDFGRKPQGCEDCGGCRQNILGELTLGTGECPGCNGKGKIWPRAAFDLKTSRSRLTRIMTGSVLDASPKSTLSSPKASMFQV